MRLLIIALILFKFSTSLFAQSYISPVKHKISLAGSFGEIRSSHFHAGIDIRPSANAVDTIYAASDGFVSRLKTQRGGFGRAIYIDHADGHTSVYAHLSNLLEPIATIVLDEQRKNENYEIDIYPDAAAIKIKKGQAIGLMGNAGNSYGKHLHFEIRETKTEVPQNPFLFGIKATDNIKPTITSVTLHGLSPDYNDLHVQSIGTKFATSENGILPVYTVPAWRAGIAVNAHDQMTGSSNKNGYYQMKLFVDDTLYFHSKMDAVSYDEGDLLDAYVDYTMKSKSGKREALLYKLPSNTVSMIKYIKSDGTIPLFAKESRKICIEVADYEGNKSFAYLYMKRDTSMRGNVVVKDCEQYIDVAKGATIEFVNGQLVIPPHALAKSAGFEVKQIGEQISIGCSDVAILKSMDICLTYMGPYYDNPKLIFAKIEGSTPTCSGGKFEGTKYCGKIFNTGNYKFILDTKGPDILPGKFAAVATKMNQFTFEIKDNIRYNNGARTFEYKVYIDGIFVPCEMKELVKTVYIPLDKLDPGNHNLVITAKDFVGNESIFERKFTK